MAITKKIKISDLKPGMKIKTKDNNGNCVFKEVTDVWNTIVEPHEQVRLEFVNGVIINCSINHPIMVIDTDNNIKEVLPYDLSFNDDVITDLGITKLMTCDIGQSNSPNYIDITVEDLHTFFTSESKDGEMVLTHNSQGGIRSASATLYVPIWHKEIDSILSFKNSKGVENSRARHLDYGIQINGFMYQRYLDGKKISCFSPKDVPGLYDAFFNDQQLFAKLYEQYENDKSIKRNEVEAKYLFEERLAVERLETGRIYIMNVDHANTHSGFDEHKVRLRISNLCTEVILPTASLSNINDELGEISLCILAAFNLGLLKSAHDFDRVANVAVRTLDALIDHQSYPIIAAEKTTKKNRALGVGVINFAYFLAKNGFKYEPAAFKLVHETFDNVQYHLLKASMTLAKEQGACEGFKNTKFASGILPIDTYKKSVDEYADVEYVNDWETLRADIVKYGLRNCTVSAIMPAESSAIVSNSTNGIEPPRDFVSTKKSRSGLIKQVVPNLKKIKSTMQLAWDMPSNDVYIKLVGIMQKFTCQAISANNYYNPENYPATNGKIPVSEVMRDLLNAYKYGLKTLYYANTNDRSNISIDDISELEDQKNKQQRLAELSNIPVTELTDAQIAELISLSLDDNDSAGCDSGACAI